MEEATKLINEFIDIEYPKGKEDRGYVILILAQFICWLKQKNYKIIKCRKK